MKRNVLFSLFVIVIVAAIGLLLLAGKRHLEKTDAKLARTIGYNIPVEVQTVEEGDISTRFAVAATAAEGASVQIRTQIEGTIISQSVALGDIVKEGQELFKIDNAIYKSNVALATALTQNRRKLLSYHNTNLAEMSKLLERDYVSQEKYKEAFLAQTQAESSMAEALHQLDDATLKLAQATVASPISGVVSELVAFPGTYIKKGEKALVINSIDPILFKLPIPEKDLQHFSIGKTVDVRISAFTDDKATATVYRVDPELNESQGTAQVYVQMPNDDLKVKPGMSGTVYLEQKSHGVRVPAIALVNRFDSEGSVFAVDSERIARIKTIRLGTSGSGYVEVLEGLKAGDKVVVAGQQSLKDGDKVKE